MLVFAQQDSPSQRNIICEHSALGAPRHGQQVWHNPPKTNRAHSSSWGGGPFQGSILLVIQHDSTFKWPYLFSLPATS